jgi:putative membrane protein
MMSVIGAVLALRHWMRLSARARLREERIAATAPASHDGNLVRGNAGEASGETAKSGA